MEREEFKKLEKDDWIRMNDGRPRQIVKRKGRSIWLPDISNPIDLVRYTRRHADLFERVEDRDKIKLKHKRKAAYSRVWNDLL